MSQQPDSMSNRISNWRLWTGVLLAPAAWVLMELIGYYIAARGCDDGGGIHAPGPTHPATLTVGLSVILTGVAAAALVIALGNWKHSHRSKGQPWEGRERFMAKTGVIGSALFVVATLLFGVPALVLDVCQHVRV